jgi:multidrug efflux pump subunit AcrB
MEALAARVLPEGISYEWTDLSYQQTTAGNMGLLVFPLCVAFVYLVLAALYGSWSQPLSILLIVPMCLLAATLGARIMGLDLSVLTQIGFIVLIGLAAKNSILIVEFARTLELQGTERRSAVVEACRLRLRPILMTSFAFVLGVFPLIVSDGAGSEMRKAVGTSVFFRHDRGNHFRTVIHTGVLRANPQPCRPQRSAIRSTIRSTHNYSRPRKP